MQLRLSGPRSLAMATLAAIFAWWLSNNQVAEIAHYRSLSHQALLDELSAAKGGQFTANALGAIFMVGMVVFGVDLLTYFYERIWSRIEGRAAPPPSPTGSVPVP